MIELRYELVPPEETSSEFYAIAEYDWWHLEVCFMGLQTFLVNGVDFGNYIGILSFASQLRWCAQRFERGENWSLVKNCDGPWQIELRREGDAVGVFYLVGEAAKAVGVKEREAYVPWSEFKQVAFEYAAKVHLEFLQRFPELKDNACFDEMFRGEPPVVEVHTRKQ